VENERRQNPTSETRLTMVEAEVHAMRTDVCDVKDELKEVRRDIAHFAETKEDKADADKKATVLADEQKGLKTLIWGLLVAVCAWALVSLFGIAGLAIWVMFTGHLVVK
jgi:hypothetical protein